MKSGTKGGGEYTSRFESAGAWEMGCGVTCARFALGLSGGIENVVSYFGVKEIHVGFSESGKVAMPLF